MNPISLELLHGQVFNTLLLILCWVFRHVFFIIIYIYIFTIFELDDQEYFFSLDFFPPQPRLDIHWSYYNNIINVKSCEGINTEKCLCLHLAL